MRVPREPEESAFLARARSEGDARTAAQWMALYEREVRVQDRRATAAHQRRLASLREFARYPFGGALVAFGAYLVVAGISSYAGLFLFVVGAGLFGLSPGSLGAAARIRPPDRAGADDDDD